MQDLRLAVRQLLKFPGFAATVVITLALGIGANTAIFTLVHAVLMKSLPVTDPATLYRIGDRDSISSDAVSVGLKLERQTNVGEADRSGAVDTHGAAEVEVALGAHSPAHLHAAIGRHRPQRDPSTRDQRLQEHVAGAGK